jgi:hypothetical protein
MSDSTRHWGNTIETTDSARRRWFQQARAALDQPSRLDSADTGKATRIITPPPAIELFYDGYLITGFGSTRIAKALMEFKPNGERYRMQLKVDSMLADLSYTSEGRIDEAGLHPESYLEERKVAFRRARRKAVRYVPTSDPSGVNQFDGKSLTVPPGTQDRLSLLIQYSLLAQADPALLTPGRETEIPFARVNSVSASRWSAGPVRPERLDGAEGQAEGDENPSPTDGSVLVAQRVARVARKKESVDVSFWLSADASRRPLILQFSENGRRLRFVARRS